MTIDISSAFTFSFSFSHVVELVRVGEVNGTLEAEGE